VIPRADHLAGAAEPLYPDRDTPGWHLPTLFNGGAAVALLAYLWNVAGKGMPVQNMRLPMACYVVGLSACGLALLFTYLTQFCLYNESIGNVKGGGHVKFQVVGIAFALLGLAAFSVGSCVAAWRF
jgi:hypothetical protein